MNRRWVMVFIAAFFEVIWVIGLAHAHNVWTWTTTIIAILVSNYLLIKASEVLPAGTAYSVFVGLGSAGAVVADILFFREPFELIKILLIILLLAGVFSLKLITDEEDRKGVES